MWINFWPLALIVTTEALSRKFSAGFVGPVVFIRPAWSGNAGKLAHELKHVSQGWRSLGLNWVFYIFSAATRFRLEVEAYQAELDAYERTIPNYQRALDEEIFASDLASLYGIQVTPEAALIALRTRSNPAAH